MKSLIALASVLALAACAGGPLDPGDTFSDCATCPDMVVISAGQFQMGVPPDEPNRGDDEGPVRTVTIAQPYAIGKYEVTRGEYAAFIGHRPLDEPPLPDLERHSTRV